MARVVVAEEKLDGAKAIEKIELLTAAARTVRCQWA
jgi:hypothetical protein